MFEVFWEGLLGGGHIFSQKMFYERLYTVRFRGGKVMPFRIFSVTLSTWDWGLFCTKLTLKGEHCTHWLSIIAIILVIRYRAVSCLCRIRCYNGWLHFQLDGDFCMPQTLFNNFPLTKQLCNYIDMHQQCQPDYWKQVTPDGTVKTDSCFRSNCIPSQGPVNSTKNLSPQNTAYVGKQHVPVVIIWCKECSARLWLKVTW